MEAERITKSEIEKRYKEAQEIYDNATKIDEEATLYDKKKWKSEYARADKEWARALAIFEELAKFDHIESLNMAGHCYCVAKGMKEEEQDYVKGAEYFRRAAELGDIEAQEAIEGLKKMGKI